MMIGLSAEPGSKLSGVTMAGMVLGVVEAAVLVVTKLSSEVLESTAGERTCSTLSTSKEERRVMTNVPVQ